MRKFILLGFFFTSILSQGWEFSSFSRYFPGVWLNKFFEISGFLQNFVKDSLPPALLFLKQENRFYKIKDINAEGLSPIVSNIFIGFSPHLSNNIGLLLFANYFPLNVINFNYYSKQKINGNLFSYKKKGSGDSYTGILSVGPSIKLRNLNISIMAYIRLFQGKVLITNIQNSSAPLSLSYLNNTYISYNKWIVLPSLVTWLGNANLLGGVIIHYMPPQSMYINTKNDKFFFTGLDESPIIIDTILFLDLKEKINYKGSYSFAFFVKKERIFIYGQYQYLKMEVPVIYDVFDNPSISIKCYWASIESLVSIKKFKYYFNFSYFRGNYIEFSISSGIDFLLKYSNSSSSFRPAFFISKRNNVFSDSRVNKEDVYGISLSWILTPGKYDTWYEKRKID